MMNYIENKKTLQKIYVLLTFTSNLLIRFFDLEIVRIAVRAKMANVASVAVALSTALPTSIALHFFCLYSQ